MISAWSSRTSGSGSQARPARPAAAGTPARSRWSADLAGHQHRPVEQETRWASSITSNPAPGQRARLVAAGSPESRPGRPTRRRRQKCGWISTGMFTGRQPGSGRRGPWCGRSAHGCRRSPRSSPGRCPAGACSPPRRRGWCPASNRTRCSRPVLRTVTSTENPCSAISESRVCSPAIIEDARCRCGGPGRLAGPWSGMNTSVTLSIREMISTESTGSSVIGCFTSTSWSTARIGAGGL